jgi:hypothetical protein
MHKVMKKSCQEDDRWDRLFERMFDQSGTSDLKWDVMIPKTVEVTAHLCEQCISITEKLICFPCAAAFADSDTERPNGRPEASAPDYF